MKILCRAPAKINLALHVTGRRDDGYHLLDTLVVFTKLGDEVLLATPDGLTNDRLDISGPFSDELTNDRSNLILKAVAHLRAVLISQNLEAPAVHIELTKNLPVSSGIGGGSADAAATLRGLSKLWVFNQSEIISDLAGRLGADVPMCLRNHTLRARGIGDEIEVLIGGRDFHLLLVNPRVSIATMDIFNALNCKNNTTMNSADILGIQTLSEHRNDLQEPAISHSPIIQKVLDEMAVLPEVQLCRMSGSGATCFGIFETVEAARIAEQMLRNNYPDW